VAKNVRSVKTGSINLMKYKMKNND